MVLSGQTNLRRVIQQLRLTRRAVGMRPRGSIANSDQRFRHRIGCNYDDTIRIHPCSR